jgi:demethylmenaquinone methyltransferase/2-methoxy-6-polyprenyl-1,4-benzoquinol methylase
MRFGQNNQTLNRFEEFTRMSEVPAPETNRGAIQRAADVRQMFDRIVPRYDLVNRVMTGWRDVAWRKMVANQVFAVEPVRGIVLDVATGTGDLALAIHKAGVRRVIGLDFSAKMIRAAVKKLHAGPQTSAISYLVGDGMRLPFADGTFDACTISFGLRNMASYEEGIREMARVLRPGGRFICLEMTPFQRPLLGPLFKIYFERIVPMVGGLLSGNLRAYRYLPRSVRSFPKAHDLAELMRTAGLEDVRYQLLGFGTVAIHSGAKPA